MMVIDYEWVNKSDRIHDLVWGDDGRCGTFYPIEETCKDKICLYNELMKDLISKKFANQSTCSSWSF